MHVFYALQDLVHNIFFMHIFHYVRPNNCVKVSLHKIEDQINILRTLRFYDIKKANYVRMTF